VVDFCVYIEQTIKLKSLIMKKVLCMIALGAISFGTFAAVPVHATKTTMPSDAGKMKKKVKTKNGKTKVKMKDSTKMGS
jgi:hypothetical protein